ncbi:MAG: lipocalin family protein, partial [Chthoniobacteraceae bacterium]
RATARPLPADEPRTNLPFMKDASPTPSETGPKTSAEPGDRKRRWLPGFKVLGGLLLGACATQDKPPLQTVAHVDLPRYMGDWRVIANIPYFAEEGAVDSIESYALRPDGKIANTFRYRDRSFDAPQKRHDFLARVTNPQTNAEWRVQFFPLISAAYLIIDLDPEYQWAVVGHPSRKYGWVLAREKTMSEHTYAKIMERVATQGYDTAKFEKVPQLPSQISSRKP